MPALEFKSPHTGQAYRVDFENDPSDEDVQKAQSELSDKEWSSSAPLEHNGNELARFLPKPAEGGGLDLTVRIPHYETGTHEYGNLNIPAVTDEDIVSEAKKASLRAAALKSQSDEWAAADALANEMGTGGAPGPGRDLMLKSTEAQARARSLANPAQARAILTNERAAEALKNSPLAEKVGHHGIGAIANEFIQSVNKLPYDMAATALDALGDTEGRDQALENFRQLQQRHPGETYPTVGGEAASLGGQFAPVVGMGPLGPLAPAVTMAAQAGAGADVRAVELADSLDARAAQARTSGDESSATTLESEAANIRANRGAYAATTGVAMGAGGSVLPQLAEGAGVLKAAGRGAADMLGIMGVSGQVIDPHFLGESQRMSGPETLKQAAIGAIIPVVHKGLEAVSRAAPNLPPGTDPAPASKQALDELAKMQALSQAQNIASKLSEESMKAREEERAKKVAEAEAQAVAQPAEELPPPDFTQPAPTVAGEAPVPDELTADEHSRYIALLSARQSGVPLDPSAAAELRTLEARNNRAVNASVNQPLPAEAPVVPEQPTIQENAIQKPEAGTVLQRESEQVGEAGGERGRVEQGVQGQEVAHAGPAGEAEAPAEEAVSSGANEPSGEVQPVASQEAPHVAPAGKVRIAGEELTEKQKAQDLHEDDVLQHLKDNSFLGALKGYRIYMPSTIEGRKEFLAKHKGHGEYDWLRSLFDRATGQFKDPRVKWLEKNFFSDNPALEEEGASMDRAAHDFSGENPHVTGGESLSGADLGERFMSEWDAAEKATEGIRKERSNQSDAETAAIRKGHEDAAKFDAVIAKDGDRVVKVSDLLDEGMDVGHPIELPDGHDAVITDVDHARGVVTVDVEKGGESLGTHELKFTDRIPVMELKEHGYVPPSDENVPFSKGREGEPVVSSEHAAAIEAVKKEFGGQIPPRVSIIHDPSKRWEARYDKANSRIIVNAAKLPLEEVVNKVNHEIGHHVWTDPKVRKAFKTLWDGLSDEQRAAIEKHVKDAYKGDPLDVRFEEKRVRAFEEVLKSAKDRSLWQKLVAAVKSAWARVTGKYPKDPQDAAQAILREGLRRLGKVDASGVGDRFSKAPRFKRSAAELERLALDSEQFKTWFSDFKDYLDDFLAHHKEYAPLFNEFLSATSASTSVPVNVPLMVKALKSFIETGEIEAALPAHQGNLERATRGERLSGPKISEYSDAVFGVKSAKPVDRHIAQIMFGTDKPTAGQIRGAKRRMGQIAERLGWEDRQVMAALWAANQKLNDQPTSSYDKHLERYREELHALFAADAAGEGRGIQAARRIAKRISETRGTEGTDIGDTVGLSRFKSESPDIRYSKGGDVSGESEDRRTFAEAPKLAEKASEPTKGGAPLTADKLASMLPYGLAGNKASLVTKGGLGRILSDLAGGARRVLDVFGGAGTYTQYLSAIGKLPKGSKLNEWEWHRALTQKWIKENPEAVISEVQSLKKEVSDVLDAVPKKLGFINDAKGKQEAYLRWVNNKLQELVNPDQKLQESEWKNFSRVPLIDDPKSAAFNYLVQELRFGNAPIEISRAPVAGLFGESGLGRPMMAEGADAKTGEPAPLSSQRIITKIDKLSWPGRLADVADTVKRASSGLKDVEVLGPWSPEKGDAWEIARNAGAGDVVPLDPPYIGAQNYGKGTSWMKDAKAFTDKLLEVTKDARERGAVFVLTNNWNTLLAKELAKAGWSSLGGKRGSGDREIISISDPGLVKSSYVAGGGVPELAGGAAGEGDATGEGLRLQAGEQGKAKRVGAKGRGGAGEPVGGEGGGEGSDVRPAGETEAGSGAEAGRVDTTPEKLPAGGPLDAYKTEEDRNAETAKLVESGASPAAIRFHQQFGEARGGAYVEQEVKPMRDFARALKGEPASEESLVGPPSEDTIAADKELTQMIQTPEGVEGLRKQFQEWWQAQGGKDSKFHTGDAVHMIIQNELVDDAVRLAATGDMSLALMVTPEANDIAALMNVSGAGRVLQARGMATSSPFWKSVSEAAKPAETIAKKVAGENLTKAEQINRDFKLHRENENLKRILTHQYAKTTEASLTAVKSMEEAAKLKERLSGADGAETAAGEVVDKVANPEGFDDSVIDKAVQGMSEEMKADVTGWWESLQRRAAILEMLEEKEGRLSLPSKAQAMKADLVGLTAAELRAELAKEDAKIADYGRKMAVRTAPAKDLLGGKAPEGEAKAPIDPVALGVKTLTEDFIRAVTPKKGKKVDAQAEVFSALMKGLRSKLGDAVPKEAKTPEDRALALGLLIQHQADARQILERTKDELYRQEATKGFTVKGGALEAATQATIGRRLDDPDKPYGRAQVRSVLAAEMGNVKATVGKLARDNVLMGKTWNDLEASLRDPKRGLEERLGKPAFDELLGAVQAEYEGNITEQRLKNLKADEKAAVAKAQAEAASADRKATDDEIRAAIQNVREQRFREATVERTAAAQNRTETRQEIRAAEDLVKEQRARREVIERPERDAQDILADLADKTPDGPTVAKAPDVRRIINKEISTDKPMAEADLRKKLEDMRVQPATIDRVVDAIGKERAERAQVVADAKETREAVAEAKAKVRRDTAPIREGRRLIEAALADKSKGLSALSDMITEAPAYLQNDPRWRELAVEEWFRRKGLSPDQAKAATGWFTAKLNDVFEKAKDKAFMNVANRDLKNQKGEKALELLRKAIRLGVTDPSVNLAEAVATEHGYRGFTPDQHKEMAALDLKLRDPNMTPHIALKYRDRLSEIVAEAGLPPEAHKILTDWFMANILGGLGTAQLHFHGYAFQMAKQLLTGFPQAVAMGPQGIRLWGNEIVRTLANAPFVSPAFWRKFGWSVMNGLHYGADNGEVLPQQSELAKVHARAMAVLDDPKSSPIKKAAAVVKIVLAANRLSMHMLGGLNAYLHDTVETHHTYFNGAQVANRFGVKPGRVNDMIREAMEKSDQFREQGEAMGLSGNDLYMHVQDAIRQSFVNSLQRAGVDTGEVTKAATGEALAVTGMASYEGGGKMKDESGKMIKDQPIRAVPRLMQWLQDITNDRPGGNQFMSPLKVVAKSALPVLKQPFNALYGEGGFYVPGWGAIRFLKDAGYREGATTLGGRTLDYLRSPYLLARNLALRQASTHGNTLYTRSLATPEMYATRMIGNVVSTAVLGGLYAMLKKNDDLPAEEKWLRTNGLPPQDKAQLAAWRADERVPESIQFRVPGSDKWFGVKMPEQYTPAISALTAFHEATKTGDPALVAGAGAILHAAVNSISPVRDMMKRGEGFKPAGGTALHQLSSSAKWSASRLASSYLVPFKAFTSSIDDALVKPSDIGKPDTRNQSLLTQTMLQVPFVQSLGFYKDVPTMVNMFGDPVGVGPNFIGIVPSDKSGARFRLPIFISQDVPQEKRELYQLMVDRAKSPSQPPTIKALSKSAKREISTEEYAEYLRVRGEHLFDSLSRVGVDRLRGMDDDELKKAYHSATTDATERAKRVVR